MLYDVEQIAQMTKVSKVTIYRKLKLNEVKPYIVAKQGKSYIDEQGLHVISQLLNVISDETSDVKAKEIEQELTIEKQEIFHENLFNRDVIIELKSEIEFLRSLLEDHSSKKEIDFLHSQLKEKDKQLESKDKLLENMQILVKNSQTKQENDIKSLDAHFMEQDEKVPNTKNEKQKKSFWSKIFGK